MNHDFMCSKINHLTFDLKFSVPTGNQREIEIQKTTGRNSSPSGAKKDGF
jgi:hypothetical protein